MNQLCSDGFGIRNSFFTALSSWRYYFKLKLIFEVISSQIFTQEKKYYKIFLRQEGIKFKNAQTFLPARKFFHSVIHIIRIFFGENELVRELYHHNFITGHQYNINFVFGKFSIYNFSIVIPKSRFILYNYPFIKLL